MSGVHQIERFHKEGDLWNFYSEFLLQHQITQGVIKMRRNQNLTAVKRITVTPNGL